MAKFTDTPHVHDDVCYREYVACGVAEHGHGAGCYAPGSAPPQLTCSQREHAHESRCTGRSLACGN